MSAAQSPFPIDQLSALADLVAEEFVESGWVEPGTTLTIGLPIEQWTLVDQRLESERAKGPDPLVRRRPPYYHHVLQRRVSGDAVAGYIETAIEDGELQVITAGTGPLAAWVEQVLARMRALRLPAGDPSSLSLVRSDSLQILALRQRWPSGRADVWIANAPADSPFRASERITEEEFLRRLRPPLPLPTRRLPRMGHNDGQARLDRYDRRAA